MKLVELHLSVLVAVNDHRVLELDHALGRQLQKARSDGFGGLLIGICNRDQIAHMNSNSTRFPTAPPANQPTPAPHRTALAPAPALAPSGWAAS
jgi:hypothetical protein